VSEPSLPWPQDEPNGPGGGPGALEELDERDVSVRMMEVGVGRLSAPTRGAIMLPLLLFLVRSCCLNYEGTNCCLSVYLFIL